MTEKPNSVCAKPGCGEVRSHFVHNLGDVVGQNHGHNFQPVAEPADRKHIRELEVESGGMRSFHSLNCWCQKEPAEPAEPSASPRKMVDVGGKEHDETSQCKYSDCKPAAPQPVAGEGPRCKLCQSPMRKFRPSGNTEDCMKCENCGYVDWKLAEGTPKLEEAAQKIEYYFVKEYGDLGLTRSRTDIDEILAILRPFITPACSPRIETSCEERGIQTLRVNGVEIVSGDGDRVNLIKWKLQKAFVATPVSTGEAAECSDEAIELLSVIENADYEEGCAAVFELRKLLPNLDRYVKDEVAEQIEKVSTGEANGQMIGDRIRAMINEKTTNNAWADGELENLRENLDSLLESVTIACDPECTSLLALACEEMSKPPAPTSVPQAEPDEDWSDGHLEASRNDIAAQAEPKGETT